MRAGEQTDRRTAIRKLIVDWGNFASASKNYVKVNIVLIEIRTRPFRNTNQVILNEKKYRTDGWGTAA